MPTALRLWQTGIVALRVRFGLMRSADSSKKYFGQVFVDSYRFQTAMDCNSRDPSRWRVLGSPDFNQWVLLDDTSKNSRQFEHSPKTWTPLFAVPAVLVPPIQGRFDKVIISVLRIYFCFPPCLVAFLRPIPPVRLCLLVWLSFTLLCHPSSLPFKSFDRPGPSPTRAV